MTVHTRTVLRTAVWTALILAARPAAAQRADFDYDPVGRLIRAERGAAGAETFSWNRAGGLTAIHAENGGLTLAVAVTPVGAGSVAGGGIACPGVCSQTFASPASVTLTASPASGWTFVGWGGAASGTDPTVTVHVGADGTAVAYFAAADGATDGDPVDDAEEMGPDGGDPSWDGNGDGIPDYQQPSVVSFHSRDGNSYLTLEVPGGVTLAALAAVDNPSPSDAPGDLFPLGFFEMTFTGFDPGACFTADLYAPDDPELSVWWKYGPTADDTSDHWWRFDFTQGHGAVFHRENGRLRIALSYCDGMNGDGDLAADGTVVDPGGPGAAASQGALVLEPGVPWASYYQDAREEIFPTTPAGSSVDFLLDLVNTGHATLNIDSIELSNYGTHMELLDAPCNHGNIPAGGRCRLHLRYTAQAGTPHEDATLSIHGGPSGDLLKNPIFSGSATEDPPPDPVQARFSVQGGGRVTSSAGGVDCTGDCTVSLGAGLFPLDFTATPDPGWRFRFWIWTWLTDAGTPDEWPAQGGAAVTNPFTISSSAGFLPIWDPIAVQMVEPTLVAVFEEVPATRTLTVERTGTGEGAVVASSVGLACGAACSVPVEDGETLTLTPSPFPGSVFAGFSGGGCSGTDPCTLTVSGSLTVQAEFEPAPEPTATLTAGVAGTGSGTVSSSPSGIFCPGQCSAVFPAGTRVTLTAQPVAGSRLGGWVVDGGGAGTGLLELDLESDTTVTARFEEDRAGEATLTLRACGPGSGTILASPGKLACTDECSATFDLGELVTLLAVPDGGFELVGLSGGGCGGMEACTVAMDHDLVVAAGFAPPGTVTGDVTGDDQVTAADDLAVLDWLYTVPAPPGDPPDANFDCGVNAADLAWILDRRTATSFSEAGDAGEPWLGRRPGTGAGQPSGERGQDASGGTSNRRSIPIPAVSPAGAALLLILVLLVGETMLRRR